MIFRLLLLLCGSMLPAATWHFPAAAVDDLPRMQREALFERWQPRFLPEGESPAVPGEFVRYQHEGLIYFFGPFPSTTAAQRAEANLLQIREQLIQIDEKFAAAEVQRLTSAPQPEGSGQDTLFPDTPDTADVPAGDPGNLPPQGMPTGTAAEAPPASEAGSPTGATDQAADATDAHQASEPAAGDAAMEEGMTAAEGNDGSDESGESGEAGDSGSEPQAAAEAGDGAECRNPETDQETQETPENGDAPKPPSGEEVPPAEPEPPPVEEPPESAEPEEQPPEEEIPEANLPEEPLPPPAETSADPDPEAAQTDPPLSPTPRRSPLAFWILSLAITFLAAWAVPRIR